MPCCLIGKREGTVEEELVIEKRIARERNELNAREAKQRLGTER